eukprot:1075205-Pleurochrysis_carterae.AAC.4
MEGGEIGAAVAADKTETPAETEGDTKAEDDAEGAERRAEYCGYAEGCEDSCCTLGYGGAGDGGSSGLGGGGLGSGGANGGGRGTGCEGNSVCPYTANRSYGGDSTHCVSMSSQSRCGYCR